MSRFRLTQTILILVLLPYCATGAPDVGALQLVPPVRQLPEPWFRPPPEGSLPRYRPGRCEHDGASIYDFSLVFAPEDFKAALACSRKRCADGDPVGCRDTAVLLLDPSRGGARQSADGLTHARRGCAAGDGSSCALLSFETLPTDPAAAMEFAEKACLADANNLELCGLAGRRLMERGETPRAVALLLRSCRGTLSAPIPGKGIDYVRTDAILLDPQELDPELNRYEGCGELSALAWANGDLEKAYEYGRLHCLHGAGGMQTCLQIAELALERRGADDAQTQQILRQGCQIVDRTPKQEAVCRYLH